MKKILIAFGLSILSFSTFSKSADKEEINIFPLASFVESGHFSTDHEGYDYKYSMWCVGKDVLLSFRRTIRSDDDSLKYISSGSGNSVVLPSLTCEKVKAIKSSGQNISEYIQKYY